MHLDHVDDAIDANADIASEILNTSLHALEIENDPPEGPLQWHDTATPADLDKARSTVRQLYRDWSLEGLDERKACYEPVLKDLDRCYDHVGDKALVKILVPGAGLGRLMYEICHSGFTVEGNEISHHQLMTSNWILNHTQVGEQHNLYPFALDFSNVVCRSHQMKSVRIPDIHPGLELQGPGGTPAVERMSMTAADFLLLYSDEQHKNRFDAVATVFFLDTAPNVIRYIETIRNCLKDDGLWINLGPLLWHFTERGPPIEEQSTRKIPTQEAAGIDAPGSVELTEDEVLMLVQEMGFHIETHEIRMDGTGYIQNPQSMLQNVYRNSHWTARKRADHGAMST